MNRISGINQALRSGADNKPTGHWSIPSILSNPIDPLYQEKFQPSSSPDLDRSVESRFPQFRDEPKF
jgi:hypothetical protein